MEKGDLVIFTIGNDEEIYEVVKSEYSFLGRKVVDLKGYPGEVAVEYLAWVGRCVDKSIKLWIK